jgi:phosphatidylinositol-3-phosphatase
VREKRSLLAATLLIALLILFLAACLSTSSASRAHTQPLHTIASRPQRMCGTRHASPPHIYRHVVWIWLENKSYNQVVGNGSAPYINHTLISECGLATNYHNITHPSLPNYVAATSGLGYSSLGRFASDCEPRGYCMSRARSIFTQVPAWRAYEQSMPHDCAKSSLGEYAVKHNPPPYYTDLAGCATKDVPYTRFEHDLKANTLPAFSFITPNLCDDTHSCPLGTGDRWLGEQMPRLFGSRAYKSGDMAVFITFDEGDDELGSSNHCAANTTDAGCRVATIVISPYTRPGTRSGTLFNHYSLLRTTEQLLGVDQFLGEASHARSMRRAFGL